MLLPPPPPDKGRFLFFSAYGGGGSEMGGENGQRLIISLYCLFRSSPSRAGRGIKGSDDPERGRPTGIF